MTLEHVLLVGAGILAGAVAALKVIAPLTHTTVDDSVLARLEQLEALVESLHLDGSDAEEAPAPEAK